MIGSTYASYDYDRMVYRDGALQQRHGTLTKYMSVAKGVHIG